MSIRYNLVILPLDNAIIVRYTLVVKLKRIHHHNTTMKTCTKCGAEKPESEFYKSSQSKDGLYQACKECHKAKVIDWQRRNPERWMETHTSYNRRRRAAHRDQQRAYNSVVMHMPAASTQACSVCGKPAEHWHHPNGYDKEHRLDVVAVCRACHIAIHQS